MVPITMTLGDYRQLQLNVTKSGVAVDLTSIQELDFTIQLAGGNVLVKWGLGNGVVVQSPAANGVAVLSVTPAMQAGIAVQNYSGTYIWSLVDSYGNPTRIIDSGPWTFVMPPPGT